MTWLISDEARKHRAFREVWVAYLLGGLYLLLGLYTEISEQNYSVLYDAQQKWNFVQQNIYSYGATLTAFLLAVGLPRLVCCEKEYRTDKLVGTAALGRRYTWRAKTAFTVLYCAAVVFIIGAASLLVNGGAFGFEGALSPVAGCVYFADTALPPMSNLAYCAIQYGFLFLGALYFAGFILIVAALTRRTALSLFLCGGSYLLFSADRETGVFSVINSTAYGRSTLFRNRLIAGSIAASAGAVLLAAGNHALSILISGRLPQPDAWNHAWFRSTVIVLIGTIGFFLFAAFVCDSLKNQPATMCICGTPFAFSYFINAAVLKKFEFFWFVRYGFFAEWMRGRRIGVTPGVWGVWYALLLGGLLLAAIHQRKERKEL